ncbi:hypothetical protein NpNSSI1_00004136 [Neofusicoccum parvum]|nr:hypothetical protein NpNSSI1_00004136 [Neofusicoccum parvum]
MIHPRLAEGITLQGKVMFVRNAGRGSHRVFLNAGTERKPFLIVRNGSDFPTGFADEWSRNEEFKSDSWRPKNWKPKSFLCKDYIKTGEGVNGAIKSEEPAKKARAPPSYLYGIEDGKPVIWTKSEFESRCGKKSAERELKNREIHRERRKQILEKARSQGVHPDTNKPLDPCDKEDMPWLFQDSLDIDASMGSTSLSAGQQYTKIISDEDDDDEDELGEDTPTRSSSEPSRGRSANAHANGPTGVSGPKNPTNGANASFSPEQKKELIDMISIAFAQLQNVNKN